MSQELDTHDSSNKLISASKIAFVASILLHLLLYRYGFPQLIIQDNQIAVEDTVATIELNPFEAARLPNLEPQWEIPEFNSSSLDGIASPLAFPNSITPIPGTFPNLPPVPIPLPPNFDLPPLPPLPPISSNIELPPIGDVSALPLPPPLEDLDSLKLPDAPATNSPDLSLPAATIKPPVEKPPEPSTTTKIKPKVTSEQIAAVRQQRLRNNIQDISASLKKQAVTTTDEAARKNYLAWLTKVKAVEPEVMEIEGVYPQDACIRRLEATSVYGVVVNASNVVVASELIKSAAYPIFNQQAIQDIQNQDFANKTNRPKPYRVTVNYQYNAEICPSLTVPSLRKKIETVQPSKTPQATPVPTPEAKPLPETQPTANPEAKPLSETQPVPTPEVKPVPETQPTSTEKNLSVPSLRERLENTPLPDDDLIRERLKNNSLPVQK
ncbi:MAG TPA: energy transducer TonB [Xenococcaceae cyanobacterium]